MEPEMGVDVFSLEIDLDYEFNAARYFDLGREETLLEAREAELWFNMAGSYPPSPFIGMLNIGSTFLVENVNTLPKIKNTENTSYMIAQTDANAGPEFSALDEAYKGWTFQDCKPLNIANDDKRSIKGPFSSGSTLMKPTASQLAKQNHPRQVKSASRSLHRFQKPIIQKSERSFEDSSENGVHAAKRQKLDGGHLLKIPGAKQQTDMVHKLLQKRDMPPDRNSQLSRLRLTIPREPELETARRAHRIKAQTLRSKDCKQFQDGEVQVTSMFKTHPSNRKILEAPSLPFLQKSTPPLPDFQISNNNIPTTVQGEAVSKRLQYNALDPLLFQNVDQKRDKCESTLPIFKARPLNKKVLSSKGDMGVFRSTKREVTIPTEFNFSTNRRCKQEPPTELFNKLSLRSETRQDPSKSKLLWPYHGATQGSKENTIGCVQQGCTVMHVEEQQKPGIKHSDFESGVVCDQRSRSDRFRSLGIR